MNTVLIIFSMYLFEFSSSVKYPIIIIPGLGGSQIEARINEIALISPLCIISPEDYLPLWIDPLKAITFPRECISKQLTLIYDNTTRKTYNMPGVQTRLPGFGQTNTIEYLDDTEMIISYFRTFVERMVEEGYIRGYSIRAAPYDFRKAPNELTEFFQNLKMLIENTYKINENKKIILLSHSLGGSVTLAFLQRQSQKWKDKYIKYQIAVSSTWAGTVKAIETFIEGITLQGIQDYPLTDSQLINYLLRALSLISPILSLITMVPKEVAATFPSIFWQFPSLDAWKKTDVLVQTESKIYTLENMEEFFRDFNHSAAWEMFKNARPFMNNLVEPGVELYCLYGVGVPTLRTVYSSGTLWDIFRHPITEDGDGMVRLQSLEICRKWIGGRKKTIVKAFQGVDHINMIKNPDVLNYIVDLVLENY